MAAVTVWGCGHDRQCMEDVAQFGLALDAWSSDGPMRLLHISMRAFHVASVSQNWTRERLHGTWVRESVGDPGIRNRPWIVSPAMNKPSHDASAIIK